MERAPVPRARIRRHRRIPSRPSCRGALGCSLLEVLVASAVVGIAALGVALMFSTAGSWVEAEGEDRAGLGLAQQKIEMLRAAGFAALEPGNPDPTSANYVASYEEGRNGRPWSAPAPAGAAGFTRLTCVQHVLDSDFNTPAYGGSAATNMPCLPYVDTSTALECATQGGTCVATNTKRTTVIVTPEAQNELRKADPVRLQAWMHP